MQIGDKVKITKSACDGVDDVGKSGVILEVDQTHVCPYLIVFTNAYTCWYRASEFELV